MRLHSYVVDHDLGFAPNPFHRVCTLANCKPLIRKHAQVGDYVVGTGSIPNGLVDRVVYWMRVDEITTFDVYWNDPRFARKKPLLVGSRMQVYGDNIYRKNIDGTYIQSDSFHSRTGGTVHQDNLETDTGTTENVLLGYEYAYWGGEGPALPPEFREIPHGTQGHSNNRFSPELRAAFVAWAHGLPGRGFLGRPANWPR